MDPNELRAEAKADRERAEQASEDGNETFSDYLYRRAAHKEWLASNRDHYQE